ncbi:MAG TPA: stage II sporulation protein P [Syntrophomonadaceae bacterium]|nr:stage II sporulation protein P [Syntrophomonadaceae bacterium]
MRRRNLWTFIKGLLFIQVFVILVIVGVSLDFTRSFTERVGSLDFSPILLPLSSLQISPEAAASLIRQSNTMMAGSPDQRMAVGDYWNQRLPRDLLVFNIQALATTDLDSETPSPDPAASQEEPKTAQVLEQEQLNTDDDNYKLFQDRLVALYCTHSGESYIPDGGDARVGGPGLIMQVANHLGQTLKSKGLPAEFIDTIHDYPDYNKSYTNSRKTVARVLAQDGSKMLALFDVHRDSIPGVEEGATVMIKGKAASPILIIVGTDARKPHPHWRENLAFAQKLYNQAAKMYPGLIKEVRTKEGTYNQEFFKNSLLLEFGTDRNSLSQCYYASELFADVLIQVLKEEL